MLIRSGEIMDALVLIFAALVGSATVEAALLDNEIQILNNFKQRYNNSKSDLVFLMDVSGSVSNYGFRTEKIFVESLLNEFSLAPYSTRVGVITFGYQVKTDINYIDIDPLSLDHQKCEFKPWFENNVKHRRGGATNMKEAFSTTSRLLQTAINNNRKRIGVHTVVIMITDGYWNLGDPRANANVLKSTYNVDLFMVGVDGYSKWQLDALASSNDHVLEFSTFTKFYELALFIRGDAHDNVFMDVSTGKCPQAGGCDTNAFCACGTVSGIYQCVCKQGYSGAGTSGNCHPCIRGTYKRYANTGDCTPCPAHSTTANVGSTLINECYCFTGYEGDPAKNIPCSAVTCEVLSAPANGGFRAACGNTYQDVCEFKCNDGYVLQQGTSSRTCQSDKTWSGSLVQCQIVTCAVLPGLSHGTKQCSGKGNEYNDQCSFSCDLGHERKGSASRTCQADGQWSGTATSCEARQCPALRQLARGGADPPDCFTSPQPYPQGCVMTCDRGYVMTGDNLLRCGPDGTWTGTFPSCDDNQPPVITCPTDVVNGTDTGSPTKTVTWSDPVAQDNSQLHDPNAAPTVVKSPNNIASPYDFPIGTTRITYTATDRSNNSQSCVFAVTVADLEPPKINCPQNKEVQKKNDIPTVTVYWVAPTYSDNSGLPVKIFTESINGSQFGVGQHRIEYSATDHANHKSTCSFVIAVSPLKCPPYDAPINGLTTCSPSRVFEGDSCTVQCNAKYEFSRVPASFYVCKDSGVWDVIAFDPKISLELPWPDCTEEYVPGAARKGMEWQYFVGNCSDPAVQEQAKRNFQMGMNFVIGRNDPNWCQSENLCALENIRVTCGRTQTKRRRRSVAQDVIIIDLDVSFITQNNDFDQSVSHLENNVATAKTASEMQSIQISSTESMTLNNVTETSTYGVCLNGSVYGLNQGFGHSTKCQNCPAGTFFDINYGSCAPCPHDTYNPYTAQVGLCTSCPKGTFTFNNGSKNISQCLAACQPGEYSPTGLINCIRCPVNTYQSLQRQQACQSCPGSSATFGIGATSISQCGMPCAPGTYSKTGVEPCLPCAKGYYQPLRKKTSCLLCGGGKSTYGVGASSIGQCLDILDCASNPCNNDATCVEVTDGYRCICKPGFTGANCEVEDDECVSNPCAIGSSCVDKVNGYLCLCPPGYTGVHCDVKSSSCNGNKCASGSTCVNTPTGHDCVCPDGYEGTFCETKSNDCKSSPCKNGGTCSVVNLSFRCSCPAGYSGTQCEKNDNGCLPDSCLNGATCEDTSYGHICKCAPGFAGIRCEVNINECSSRPCQNYGSCVDQINGYKCYCKPSFTGTNCETEVSTDFDMEFSRALGRGASIVENRQELRAFTVAFWMKVDDSEIDPGTPVSYAVSIGDGDVVDNALVIHDYNGFNIWVMGEKASTGVPATDGKWHHIALTWQSSNGTWKVYKDGSKVKQNSDAEPFQRGQVIASGGLFVLGQEQDQVGQNFSANEAFIGKMSQLNIWNYELGAQDIADMARHSENIIGNVVAWSDFYGPADTGIEKIQPSAARTENRCWTNWINNDLPSTGTGDTETSSGACAGATHFDCQTVDGFNLVDVELNMTTCSNSGITCLNSDQRADRSCPDFKVRYVCSCPANTACNSNPCGAHGTCQSLPVGYKCICNGGYEGRHCETVVKCPCTGKIPNGGHSGSRLPGGTMTIACRTGFKTNGSPTLNCVNGKWDAAVPQCIDIDECTEGTSGCGQNCVNTYGSYLCKCNAGYSLNADGKTCSDIDECNRDNGNCQQSCHNSVGSYLCTCASGYTLAPDARSCADTNECSSNGGRGPCQHICVNTLLGRQCLCNPGYTLNADGTHCTALSCPSISNVQNGKINPANPATTVDSTVRFECNVGYILKGASTRTCLADGTWSGVPPRCILATCIIPGELKDGTRSTSANVYNTVVSYACNSGFRLVGSATRTCQANGQWSGEHPRCIAADCPEPSEPSNGKLIGLQRKNGDTVRYECNVGYNLVGQSFVICQNNAWSAATPSCNKVNCGTPPPVTNGIITGSDYTYNAKITYSCVAANFKLSGSQERTCQADGTWSGTQPFCLENSCGNPGTPENGQKNGVNYKYYNVVTFKCNLGYNLIGSSSRTCQTNGNWNGTQPTCQLINCGDPGTPANGERLGSEFSYDKTIIYDCVPGYQLSGTRTRTCQLDGTWSGSVPSCVSSTCGASLVGPSGTFTSPNNPNSYPDNAYCRWKISVPVNKKVLVTFNTFKTQKDKDVVEIYDGTSKLLITKLSGVYSKAIPFASESNVIDVRFISDGSENSEGFSASYEQVSCGGIITQLGQSVMSPNYPSNYDNNLVCVWVIIPGQQFQLEFEKFYTEPAYDLLKAYSSLSSFTFADLIFDLDDERVSQNIRQVPGGVMYLKFTTNDLNTYPGFKATVRKFQVIVGK
ncbi:sushi, von Willebrand factor type A, EGF and pentraxin domain-containing protein 1-like [Montipora capricornis]|uniref:sushi, von Willebrand factor type A, EGF and pentraxin domain-containing protein 1-like n=1 Tax=Montipora capricornis TaxID=246305 RepID=UPI0035F1DE7D